MKHLVFILLLLSSTSLLAQKKDLKYPDRVVEAYYSGYFDVLDSLYGGQGLNYPILMDVNKILGRNKDKWFVSLPTESYLILQYTDNEITDIPQKNDILVTEHGCCHEEANIYVSNDGVDFTFLGKVDDCNNNELDLADINYTQSVKYIKVVGLDVKCASPGFDLVTVFGINGANKDLYATMEEAEAFFENEAEERILILENVYFEPDSDVILPEGEKDLWLVIEKLQEYPKLQVKLTGHTDSQASDSHNLNLSQRRAKSVKTFLLKNGIPEDRIKTEGKGESLPLRTNETEEGRAVNRRVELRRLN